MINKAFDEDIKRLDPLKVYYILEQHDLLNTKLEKYKPIVNNNIQSTFAAVGNLCWNNLAVSKKAYF